jgi:hypothetical protein
MASPDQILGRLFSCCDAMYRGLGEAAGSLSVDAFVVRTHEMSRALGATALELREALEGRVAAPLAVIEATLTQAAAHDPSGALVLFTASMVVGPRVLVSVRDAREALGPGPSGALCDRVADVLVREIHQIGEVARRHPVVDDEAWHGVARDLVATLDHAGFAESFGPFD